MGSLIINSFVFVLNSIQIHSIPFYETFEWEGVEAQPYNRYYLMPALPELFVTLVSKRKFAVMTNSGIYSGIFLCWELALKHIGDASGRRVLVLDTSK